MEKEERGAGVKPAKLQSERATWGVRGVRGERSVIMHLSHELHGESVQEGQCDACVHAIPARSGQHDVSGGHGERSALSAQVVRDAALG